MTVQSGKLLSIKFGAFFSVLSSYKGLRGQWQMPHIFKHPSKSYMHDNPDDQHTTKLWATLLDKTRTPWRHLPVAVRHKLLSQVPRVSCSSQCSLWYAFMTGTTLTI